MRVFVTGTAGFIGFHLARQLLAVGHEVTGYDGMTPYYDVRLKRARHRILGAAENFHVVEGLLEDEVRLKKAVADAAPDVIVHLAAQAGVRYSIDHPDTYITANLVGTAHLLEAARSAKPAHMLFASTSSVYGGNEKTPFTETDRSDGQLSLYAATKKSGESMTHSYSHLWDIPTTCFRFFTVYGPWGRPDMALFKFVEAIESDRPIEIYGEGRMRRDFTYVDDLVAAIVRLLPLAPQKGRPQGEADSLSPTAPWRVVNIAGGKPIELMAYVEAIEAALGKSAKKLMLPMQPGDVVQTIADTTLLRSLIGFVPETTVEDGVRAFVDWYRSDYQLALRQ